MESDNDVRLERQGLIHWYQGESDQAKLKLEALTAELSKTLDLTQAIELFYKIETWQQRLLDSEGEILKLTRNE